MTHRKAAAATLHEARQPSNECPPLVALVETMAEEIERLGEDNKQLRAAVSLYRAALEKYSGRPTSPA